MSQLIRKIDAVEIFSKEYKFKEDSSGNIMDTVLVKKMKVINGKKAFEEVMNYTINDIITTKNYYSDHLIYATSFSNRLGMLSVFKAFEKDGKIEFASFVLYEEGNVVDSIYMKYSYKYSDENNLLEQKIVAEADSEISESYVYYDAFTNPVKEGKSINGSKVQEIVYNYKDNGILMGKSIISYTDSIKNVLKYDDNGFIKQETLYSIQDKKLSPQIITDYIVSTNGNVLSEKRTYISLNKVDIYTYKYVFIE